MAGVYSTRFIAIGPSAVASFTAQVGTVCVIRNITVAQAGDTELVAWSVRDGTANVYIATGTLPLPGSQAGFDSESRDLRYVLPTNSVLLAASGAGMYLTVSGYTLALP